MFYNVLQKLNEFCRFLQELDVLECAQINYFSIRFSRNFVGITLFKQILESGLREIIGLKSPDPVAKDQYIIQKFSEIFY